MNFKDPLVLSIIGGLIATFGLYLNDRKDKKKTENINLIKIFLLVFLICYGIQIVNTKNVTKSDTKIHIGNPHF